MKKTLIALLLTATLWAGGTAVLEGRQGFNAQIQAALNALGYVTSTNTVVQWSKSFLMAASSYINFGATSGVNGYGIRDNAGVIEGKNSGGAWASLVVGGGTAPSNATYITQTPNATLTNEQAMSALTTGFVLNTTGTGVQSVWAGSGCSNGFISNIANNGTLTCAQTFSAGIAIDGGTPSTHGIMMPSGTPGTLTSNLYNNGGNLTWPTGLTVLGISNLAWAPQLKAYTPGDTTPSVANASTLTITNSGPVTITNFTGGVSGQIIILTFSDANTTINRDHCALAGGANYTSAAGAILVLMLRSAVWTEVSRAAGS